MSDCGELLQELVKLAKVCPPLLADIEVSVCRLAASHCPTPAIGGTVLANLGSRFAWLVRPALSVYM